MNNMSKYGNGQKSQFGQRKGNGSNPNNSTSNSGTGKPQEANPSTKQNPDQPNPNQQEQAQEQTQIVCTQESAANGQSDVTDSGEDQAKGKESDAPEGDENGSKDAGRKDGNSDTEKPKSPDEPAQDNKKMQTNNA